MPIIADIIKDKRKAMVDVKFQIGHSMCFDVDVTELDDELFEQIADTVSEEIGEEISVKDITFKVEEVE